MIKTIYELLVEEFGEVRWWPSDSDFEMITGAILTQRTRWENVEAAIAGLKRAGLMSPEAMSRASSGSIEDAIRPVGFYRQKARYIKGIAGYFSDHPMKDVFSLPEGPLRAEMLKLRGVGKETADCILLYAARKPVFVIDAYTKRMFGCLGMEGDYDALQDAFEGSMEKDPYVYGQYHGLIVEHGKRYCNKKRCEDCVVKRYKNIAGH
ncbi:hypothetical protein CUJ83_06345 [Methanocella sp. CWC-04]|uniref:HhH-GPD domain-containing protein n=1 Tax=Methanooceanicella nereidis TaxID=2052831 RepID=A0AAP2RBV5_9EURY|nr:DNA-3-methyladenine glycosylase [Methanocella sp. CWC-04]MCD1294618.1 hypothetical protein [Methanocella sp. CWC-04]